MNNADEQASKDQKKVDESSVLTQRENSLTLEKTIEYHVKK